MGVPQGAMAVPAGTGDSVIPKNMVPAVQMGRGMFPISMQITS